MNSVPVKALPDFPSCLDNLKGDLGDLVVGAECEGP